MNHGIAEKHLQTIKKILAQNCQSIQKVCLFGSRATGNFTHTSDIDLVLYGNVSAQESDRLYTCFYESMLPHKVDITTYQLVNYPPLRRHIDAAAKELFDHKQLYG